MKINPEYRSKNTRRNQGTRRGHTWRPRLEVLENRLAPATLTWRGNLSANWGDTFHNPITGNTITNWVGNGLPQTGDTLVFDDTAQGNFTTNNDMSDPFGQPLRLSGISINTNTGYTLNGNPIAINSAAGITCGIPNIGGTPVNTITLDVTLGAAQTWTTDNLVSLLANLLVTGQVKGSGNLTKAGLGSLRLRGNNTYTGTTTISAGTLQVEANNALGAAAAGTSVAAGATLQFRPFGIVIPPAPPPSLNYSTPEPVTVNGGTIRNESFNNTFAGPIQLAADSVITTQANTLTLTGIIDGSGGLTKNGAGTLELDSTDNNYDGATLIAEGMLRRGTHTNIPDQSAVTVFAGATLDLEGTVHEYIGSLAGEGQITIGTADGLAVRFDSTQSTFNGTISGSGDLWKYGSGTLILSGNTTYPGPLTTAVIEGTLAVNGPQPNIAIELDGGTLGGTGTVGSITAPPLGAGGTISPNTIGAVGTLSVIGNVTLNSATTLTAEMHGSNVADYDRLVVHGTVDLGSSRLSVSLSGYQAPFNTSFTIIDNDVNDPITGTFRDPTTSNSLPEGAVFIEPGTGRKLQISYTSGDGNDVVLTVVNTAPSVDAGANATINEGDTFTRSVSFTDPDPDGETATVDYGDGFSESFTVFASPFNLHDHVYANSGVYTVAVTVTDSQNGQGFDAFSVTVNNLPPTATITGPASGVRGQTLAFTLTATDPSPADQAANFTYRIDWDGDGTVDETVTAPSPKQIDHNFSELGSFTVRMTAIDKDGGESDVATDAIDIINVNPSVDAGPDAAVDEAAIFSGSGSFTDSDPDTWSATVNFGDGSGTQPLTLNADKTFDLSHVYPDNGQFTVTVTVTDNHGGADADALVVTVNNVAPTAVITGPASGGRGQALTFTLAANDPSSVDQGANFTYRIDWDGDGTVDDIVVAPSPKQFDHSFSSLGSFTIRLTATDKDNAASAVATHTIDIVNVAPTVNAGADAAIDEAATFSRTGSFADSDPDTWTASVNYGDGAGNQALTLHADKTFDLNHVYVDNGQFTVTVTVMDNHSGVGNDTVIVTVNNVPPTANITGPSIGKRGQPLSYTLTASDPSPVDQAANFTYRIDWDGDGTVDQIVTGLSGLGVNHTYSAAGTFAVRVTVTDKDSAVSGAAIHPLSVAPDYLVVGPDSGSAPRVRVFDAASPHTPKLDFLAYPAAFKGGVRVAVADINGDGCPDIITAPGPGTAGVVKVFSGNTAPGQTPALLLPPMKPYGNSYKGGVFVTAGGDANGDGIPDIITGPGAGVAPIVKIFSGATGALLGSFRAFPGSFSGGVTVAAGDVNGDGKLDIVAGMGAGNKPRVRVFNAASHAQLPGLIGNFLAYGAGFTGGVYVAAGDLNGDGVADIITGPGAGAAPVVKIFDQNHVTTARAILAYPGTMKKGVRVGIADANGDGKAEILTALGPGGKTLLRSFNGLTLQAIDSFFAGVGAKGLFVAGSR